MLQSVLGMNMQNGFRYNQLDVSQYSLVFFVQVTALLFKVILRNRLVRRAWGYRGPILVLNPGVPTRKYGIKRDTFTEIVAGFHGFSNWEIKKYYTTIKYYSCALLANI